MDGTLTFQIQNSLPTKSSAGILHAYHGIQANAVPSSEPYRTIVSTNPTQTKPIYKTQY